MRTGTAMAVMLWLTFPVLCRQQIVAARLRGNWVSAWGTAQQLAVPARAIPSPATWPKSLSAQTLRMVARCRLPPGGPGRVVDSFGYAPSN